MTNNANNTKVITGKVRFSYVKVFDPEIDKNGKENYSVSLIIDKKDKKTLDAIEKAVDNAKQAGITKLGGKNGKIPGNLKLPLRDGDKDREDDEAYAGKMFVNAKCRTRPGIVYKNGQPIIDTTDFYSGCYGYASISFYAFNTDGNKGIACSLNNLMKLEDGEPLGGRAKAEDDFAALIQTDEDDEDNFLD